MQILLEFLGISVVVILVLHGAYKIGGDIIKFDVDKREAINRFLEQQVASVERKFNEFVQNAIDAGATELYIRIENDRVTVWDNGSGMTNVEIIKKYGTLCYSDKHGKENMRGEYGVGRMQILGMGRVTMKTRDQIAYFDVRDCVERNIDYQFRLADSGEMFNGCHYEIELYEPLDDDRVHEIGKYLKNAYKFREMEVHVTCLMNGGKDKEEFTIERDTDEINQIGMIRFRVITLGTSTVRSSESVHGGSPVYVMGMFLHKKRYGMPVAIEMHVDKKVKLTIARDGFVENDDYTVFKKDLVRVYAFLLKNEFDKRHILTETGRLLKAIRRGHLTKESMYAIKFIRLDSKKDVYISIRDLKNAGSKLVNLDGLDGDIVEYVKTVIGRTYQQPFYVRHYYSNETRRILDELGITSMKVVEMEDVMKQANALMKKKSRIVSKDGSAKKVKELMSLAEHVGAEISYICNDERAVKFYEDKGNIDMWTDGESVVWINLKHFSPYWPKARLVTRLFLGLAREFSYHENSRECNELDDTYFRNYHRIVSESTEMLEEINARPVDYWS